MLRLGDLLGGLAVAVLLLGAPLLLITTLLGVDDTPVGQAVVGVPVLLGWLIGWAVLHAARPR